MSSVRAFLAIPLTGQLKESIGKLQQQLQTKIPDVRWVRPENLHLTLHFFGAVEQETLEKIKVSVLSVKRCQRPFQVAVNGLGAFPSLHKPRIVWLGMEPDEQIRLLHSRCRKALHRLGIDTETRTYSPHLTIGRLRRQGYDISDVCRAEDSAVIGPLQVDRLVLFESRLHPQGAEHLPLLTVSLENEINQP